MQSTTLGTVAIKTNPPERSPLRTATPARCYFCGAAEANHPMIVQFRALRGEVYAKNSQIESSSHWAIPTQNVLDVDGNTEPAQGLC